VDSHIHLSRALPSLEPQQALCARAALPEWLRGLFAQASRFAKRTSVKIPLVQPGMHPG
jgi:hypothetical protein